MYLLFQFEETELGYYFSNLLIVANNDYSVYIQFIGFQIVGIDSIELIILDVEEVQH